MLELDLFLAVHAPDELGDVLHWPGAVERDGGDDVLEGAGLHLGEDAAHALAFDLEDAADLAAGEQLEGFRRVLVFERDVGEAVVDVVALADQAGRLAHDGERAEAEEIDFEQPDGFEDRELVLGDGAGDRVLVAAHERRVVRQLAVGHDHGGGMHAGMARHAFQVHRRIEQVAHPFVFGVLLRQVPAVEVMAGRKHVADGGRFAGDGGISWRSGRLRSAGSLGAAHVADGGAPSCVPKVTILLHLVLTVFFQRIADHVLTVIREVQVEVGR